MAWKIVAWLQVTTLPKKSRRANTLVAVHRVGTISSRARIILAKVTIALAELTFKPVRALTGYTSTNFNAGAAISAITLLTRITIDLTELTMIVQRAVTLNCIVVAQTSASIVARSRSALIDLELTMCSQPAVITNAIV